MKKLSGLLAVVLAVLMIATAFVGCHEKNEIAFTIGESKFTSAMYSCVLFSEASTARSTIDTFLSDNEQSTENVKYSNYKFNDKGEVTTDGTGTTYNTYVRNEAIKQLKVFAALDKIFKEKNLTVDSETLNYAMIDAESMWYFGCDYNTYYQYASMGYDPSQIFPAYGPYFEANGVAYSTYQKYHKYQAMYEYYFTYVYGEKGEKAVAKDDIVKFANEHHVLGDMIQISTKNSKGDNLSSDEIKKLEDMAAKYVERLNNGESFEVIYNEETKRAEDASKAESSTSSGTSSTTSNSSNTSSNASSNASSTTSSTASSTTSSTNSSTTSSGTTSSGTEKKEYSPESYKYLAGDKETSYENDLYERLKKGEIGKAFIVKTADDKANDYEDGYIKIFVKRDLFDKAYEDYFYKSLETNVRFNMKEDEYNTTLETAGNALKLTEDKHATEPFGVADIKFTLE